MEHYLIATGTAWWLALIKFIAASLLAFLLPGSLCLSSKMKSRPPFVYFTLSILVGLVLWAWQEFLFGYLRFRDLSYLYLLAVFLISAARFKTAPLKRLFSSSKRGATFVSHLKKADLFLGFLVVLGVFIQVFPLWNNGTVSPQQGLVFKGGNTEDNLWHASLTWEIVKRFPPSGPGLPDTLMKNYHYWSNLTIASLIRVFKLPLFPTQFHFFPLLISLLLGLTAISFAKILNFNKTTTRLLVFFNYFGGDLIYLFRIVLGRGPNFFSMSSLEDGTKFLYNPPRAFSFVIALGGMALFYSWQKKKKTSLGLLSMLLLASTTGFKIYTSLFFGPGILCLALVSLFKRNWRNTLVFTTFFLLSALIYLPSNTEAGGLIWAPFSIVNNFIVQPDLGLDCWEMARQIFLADGKHLHNLIFETGFTLIFLVGILGTKLAGFIQSPIFLIRKLGPDLVFLVVSGMVTSLGGGLFFVQTTGGANTFNFLVSAFLFGSILAAISITYWQTKLPRCLGFLLTFLVVLTTIPRVSYETVFNIKDLFQKEGFLISRDELDLYRLIHQDPSPLFTVAVDPDHNLGRNTPYVSLFLDQSLLLSGPGLLKHFGLNIESKKRSQDLIFQTGNEKILARELLAHQVKYILLYEHHRLQATQAAFFSDEVLQNQRGKVIRVDQEKLRNRFSKIYKMILRINQLSV